MTPTLPSLRASGAGITTIFCAINNGKVDIITARGFKHSGFNIEEKHPELCIPQSNATW